MGSSGGRYSFTPAGGMGGRNDDDMDDDVDQTFVINDSALDAPSEFDPNATNLDTLSNSSGGNGGNNATVTSTPAAEANDAPFVWGGPVAEGSWICPQCDVTNNKDEFKCPCCEYENPNADKSAKKKKDEEDAATASSGPQYSFGSSSS